MADSDYLVLSRGHWNADLAPRQIQEGIDAFYVWFDRMHAEGWMRPGSRLRPDTALVTHTGLCTDGPFSESKEIVGGFWFVRAASLQHAANLLQGSPTLALGLHYEVRPLDPLRADAGRTTCESI